jgi:predicted O-methyltransferase YrrM
MNVNKLGRIRRRVREDGLHTIPAWVLRWIYCNGRLYHLRFHRLPELRFWAMEKLGLIPEVRNPDFEPLDPELNSILDNATTDEYASFKLAPHMHGSNQQRQRVAEIAEMCARRHPGDFVEIGAYLGETTNRLAEVARKHHRRVIAVDPWEPGTQNCEGWEYEAFLQNIEPYADIVEVVRASSLDKSTKALISERALCFAFVDGLHTYEACLSDIRTVAHTRGIIVVDDVLWSNELMRAFRRGAYFTRRIPVHHPLCREGYLLPSSRR